MLKDVTVEVWELLVQWAQHKPGRQNFWILIPPGLTTHPVAVGKALPSLCLSSFLWENYLFFKRRHDVYICCASKIPIVTNAFLSSSSVFNIRFMKHFPIQILRLKYLKHFAQIHLEIPYSFFLNEILSNQFEWASSNQYILNILTSLVPLHMTSVMVRWWNKAWRNW